MRGSIYGRANVTWRRCETVGPPAGGRIEDEVALGSGIAGGGKFSPVQFPRFVLGFGRGDDREPGNLGRIPVPFPADESGNPVSLAHPSTLKDPVLGLGANPIGAAGKGREVASADQQA